MTSLIMDTSNQYTVVAIYEDGKCLETMQELGTQRQSESAIPFLEVIADRHHKEIIDMEEIIITYGPGSYTGVRVAMTVAKTLAAISPIKVKAMSSLKAYAGLEKCVSVIDARSHKVFVGVYNEGKNVIEDQMIDIQDFETFMKDYPDYKVVGQVELVNYPTQDVDLAKNMYEIALLNDYVENVEAMVPFYLKDVEAKKICL